MEKLILCRHGETAWTKSAQHTGKTDLALTISGEKQAALLRGRLKDFSFDKAFCSPLKRAQETASGLGVETDPLLKEWDYGAYEGKTHEEIQRENPGWNLFEKGAPGGESVEEVAKRADRFLEKIAKVERTAVVFSHGHFLRVLAARFLHLPGKKGAIFSLSVASLCILGYEHKLPTIILWNEISHLADLKTPSKDSDDPKHGKGRS